MRRMYEFLCESGVKIERLADYEQQIAAAFGVPAHKVGDTDAVSWGSSEQADAEFVKHTLSSNDILPAGRYIEFDLHDYLEVNDMSENGVEVEDSADVRISEDSRS